MEELSRCFDFQGQQIISIIGSGGKTSLMWYLANCYRQEKVLVSTTTKIGYPVKRRHDFFYSSHFSALEKVGQGITLAGTLVADGKKLGMIPLKALKKNLLTFDKIFLEADGSKQLPLKGWADFEPVILPETTVTIGILPIIALGKKANEETVHRLPIFLKTTGMAEGDTITEKSMALIISSAFGLWEKSRGEKILCLNQVESTEQLNQAKKIVALLPSDCLKSVTKVIACSVKNGKGVIIWNKN
ncbi:selenium cofactor biosynthesis protein YqeC [Enterococcus rivorum]|uniref:Hydroxylase n=1 Tax=Enterococcus rivorum TaxID=762845 RepID=A0A1E5KTL0_9ENTE|nr:selenium cofactor biosynthesis protein YqeC [Enterococcus rivorum]MBP2097947.1 putative selenium-dependent hydroxylase accessory protein YqeC [Enterococcus rivorum]OEH81200.1 hydroxylase [Enterococcus rivorum]